MLCGHIEKKRLIYGSFLFSKLSSLLNIKWRALTSSPTSYISAGRSHLIFVTRWQHIFTYTAMMSMTAICTEFRVLLLDTFTRFRIFHAIRSLYTLKTAFDMTDVRIEVSVACQIWNAFQSRLPLLQFWASFQLIRIWSIMGSVWIFLHHGFVSGRIHILCHAYKLQWHFYTNFTNAWTLHNSMNTYCIYYDPKLSIYVFMINK
jgi:hypothetical protein